jgi:hypothetical protein
MPGRTAGFFSAVALKLAEGRWCPSKHFGSQDLRVPLVPSRSTARNSENLRHLGDRASNLQALFVDTKRCQV